jgi:hypothetical protein
VKTHLQHILVKLDARNRLEAASLALKLKLTEEPDADEGDAQEALGRPGHTRLAL